MKILLFGRAREIVGAPEIELEISNPAAPLQTTGGIVAALVAKYPLLAPWKEHLRIAVNREYAPAEREVSPGDEIALIPPVSGG